jgi:hypothetical protein
VHIALNSSASKAAERRAPPRGFALAPRPDAGTPCHRYRASAPAYRTPINPSPERMVPLARIPFWASIVAYRPARRRWQP